MSVVFLCVNTINESCYSMKLSLFTLCQTADIIRRADYKDSPTRYNSVSLAIKNFECILAEQAMSFKKSNAISRNHFYCVGGIV